MCDPYFLRNKNHYKFGIYEQGEILWRLPQTSALLLSIILCYKKIVLYYSKLKSNREASQINLHHMRVEAVTLLEHF